MKKIVLRVYITENNMGVIINKAIESGLMTLVRSLEGRNGLLAIYDIEISEKYLPLFISIGLDYLPLNHYECFIITCPICGERIDDDMILNVYDDKLLSGYNIRCDKTAQCTYGHAKVEYINTLL